MTLLEEPDRRREMGLNGRARVEERFSLGRAADAQAEIIATAVRHRRARRNSAAR
jgi:hypothetical protein